jgi:hypothetical protein
MMADPELIGLEGSFFKNRRWSERRAVFSSLVTPGGKNPQKMSAAR